MEEYILEVIDWGIVRRSAEDRVDTDDKDFEGFDFFLMSSEVT